MELLNFLNEHPNDWQSILSTHPYNLSISQDGDYFLLKYEQFLSNFNFNLVKEARGSIFRFDKESQKWICVCYPFKKFFNYGEQYSDVKVIDWETAHVQQKIDGSLIKFWYDYNEWHISTNGTIDAFKSSCGSTNFGILVSNLVEKIPNFYDSLNSEYCYMFELTTPYNPIVVRYAGSKLWFLGRRNMTTFAEDRENLRVKGIMRPKLFHHHSLAECVAAAHEMGADEEGYVVCDVEFHRIKIKGDEYLRLHKMRGNGQITAVRVVEMWQQDALDDFVAYFPEYKAYCNNILAQIKHYIDLAEIAFHSCAHITERKLFADYAKQYLPPIRAYLFARLDNKTESALSFFKEMRTRTIVSHLKLNELSIGVIEDE